MSDCKGCKYWTQAIDDYANGKHTDKEPNPFCSTCEGDKYQPRGAKETKAFLGAKIDAQAAEINELKNELAFQIRRNEVNESALSEKIKENARMREALEKLMSECENGDYLWIEYIKQLVEKALKGEG